MSLTRMLYLLFVTLEHKTSHTGQFCDIEMYASYESWINNIYIDLWFVWTIFENLESEGVKTSEY